MTNTCVQGLGKLAIILMSDYGSNLATRVGNFTSNFFPLGREFDKVKFNSPHVTLGQSGHIKKKIISSVRFKAYALLSIPYLRLHGFFHPDEWPRLLHCLLLLTLNVSGKIGYCDYNCHACVITK